MKDQKDHKICVYINPHKNPLKWYEWLGWVVEFCLVGFGMLCLYTFFQEKEWRAFLLVLAFFALVSGGWLWILLQYPKS